MQAQRPEGSHLAQDDVLDKLYAALPTHVTSAGRQDSAWLSSTQWLIHRSNEPSHYLTLGECPDTLVFHLIGFWGPLCAIAQHEYQKQ